MHDIDRVRLESQSEAEMLEAVPFEAEQFEFPQSETSSGETGEVFGETEQMELASELLEVTNEAELDRFLGDLIHRAGQAVGKFIKSPEGQAIGSALKGAAKQVLPAIGSAVGGYLGGSTGAKLGGDAASVASRAFGLELEGLSGEDVGVRGRATFRQLRRRGCQEHGAGASGNGREKRRPFGDDRGREDPRARTAVVSRGGDGASAASPALGGAQRPLGPSRQQDHSVRSLTGHASQLLRALDARPGSARVVGAARSGEAVRALRAHGPGGEPSARGADRDRAFPDQGAPRAEGADPKLSELAAR